MKKKGFIYMILFFLVLITGCSDFHSQIKNFGNKGDSDIRSDQEGNFASDTLDIALVMKTLSNPFFIEMENGARKAESEFGINLIVKTAAQETSTEQQIYILEELIKEKVDAIVIAPGRSTELVPVLKKAQESGIVIVNIDNRLDTEMSKKIGLVNVPFISVDNEEAAYLSVKYISDTITVPTEVAVIEGIIKANNSGERKKGALRAFSENKNIKVVAIETANWKIDEALQVATKLLKIHPNLGAIYCANDMMAIGASQAIMNEGLKNVKIGGFDALKETVLEIEEGKIMVTVDQQAGLQGYMGIEFALKLLKGEMVQKETFIDIKLVTKN